MSVMVRKCAAVAALALLSACGGGGGGDGSPTAPNNNTPGTPSTPSTPGANEVLATTGNAFSPSTLTVSRGTTVTFTFQATQHNVNFASVAGAPANISNTANSGVQRLFATAGTFGYDCSLHSGMSGTVIVN
ncbi:MAG: cupredoxin domain-containing protein [Gemmatimonadaceae bacterium]|nr:cupredoxin domain-containing protein [Gemmatimonadaceae bacterium]